MIYSAERQRNRMYGSMTNLSVNGHTLDLSKINSSIAEDALSNRLRAELDRSIAKHLEAGMLLSVYLICFGALVSLSQEPLPLKI